MPKIKIDPPTEQISRMEATIRDLEDTGQRALLLARDLRRQVETLKNGRPEPARKITDWKREVESWKNKNQGGSK